ncbi:cache domain-containing protein [Rhodoferax sp. GW822-FHT02A01]|uniref:cache domain-containing protein n=1 Tax=Rhodoferax sp. GW822-FHT02A01 TaxID=3141537 RepID=UPI00315D8D14
MSPIRGLFIALIAAFISLSSIAQERGTKEEAKNMVNAALAHIKQVGNSAAFNDFSSGNGLWVNKDLYVSVLDNKGLVLAHGANQKLIGKVLIEFKDQNGKLFIQEMISVANKGDGWVDYDFTNPVSKKVEGKSSYVKRIPNFDGFVFVGVYR